MSSSRVKLTVAYDGTDFRGWAAQRGQRTVLGTLTEAVRRVSGEELEIVGASRTDSGAHALGQVCHLDTVVQPDRLVTALNRVLPLDLRVTKAARVPETFNSRFCAKDRTYVYAFSLKQEDPFRMRTAYGHWQKLDLDAMRAAAAVLQGRHDFRAFTEEIDPTIENFVRDLYSVQVRQHASETLFEVRGTAFLRGMMRRMAGLIYDVGRGKRHPDEAAALLGPERDQMHWPTVLPARGLTLIKVRYGRHPRDHRQLLDNDD